MNWWAQSNQVTIFYLLLGIDVVIIITMFNGALLMPLGLANFFADLLLGSISLLAGVWETVQYSRGSHALPILLCLSLALVGLIMVVGFFIIFNALKSVVI